MAKCTSCGNVDAYVGSIFVECPNMECTFFSTRTLREVRDAKRSAKRAEEAETPSHVDQTDPDETPIYGFTALGWPFG